MLPPGKYRTKAGSTMVISGKHGGVSEVDFDWFEEEGACLDCKPQAYDDDGFLVWFCSEHESGRAQLFKVGD